MLSTQHNMPHPLALSHSDYGPSHSANSETPARLGGLWVMPARLLCTTGTEPQQWPAQCPVVLAVVDGQLQCQTAAAGTADGLASSRRWLLEQGLITHCRVVSALPFSVVGCEGGVDAEHTVQDAPSLSPKQP